MRYKGKEAKNWISLQPLCQLQCKLIKEEGGNEERERNREKSAHGIREAAYTTAAGKEYLYCMLAGGLAEN
jgi:hypothetical protein